jgi:hypothetical protein
MIMNMLDLSKNLIALIDSLDALHKNHSVVFDRSWAPLIDKITELYDNNPSIWPEIDGSKIAKLRLVEEKIATRQKLTKNNKTKQIIAQLGLQLCDILETADTADLFAIFNQSYDMFRELVEWYYEDTNDIEEDIGISLGEASNLKLNTFNSNIPNDEWLHYLKDDRDRLDTLLLEL